MPFSYMSTGTLRIASAAGLSSRNGGGCGGGGGGGGN